MILPDNPVLTKELRVRMRGSRAYWILFGYLGFLSFVLLGRYGTWKQSIDPSGGGSSEVAQLGGEIFLYLVITQMFLVLFITPAITSGSITLEKEQRTLDMLTMTRMPRRSIIMGKLLSAVSFTALLLISSLPLVSICFMLGSVDPVMVISTYLMLLFGSFLIGAMGLMWSSIARSTTTAVLYTYATLFFLFVAGAIEYMVSRSPFGGGSLSENVVLAVADPLFGPNFLGLHGPAGIGFAILCLLGGILMSAVAMARLEMFPERKARLLRGLTLLLVGVSALAADTWWLGSWYHRGGQAIMRIVQPPIGVLIVTAILLMLLIPTFATGELRSYEARRYLRHLLWGWTPRGLSRGKLASGLPFLLILTLLCLAMYALSFLMVGKPGDIAHSARLTASAVPAPPVGGALMAGNRVIQGGVVVNGRVTPGATIVNGRVVPAPGPATQPKNTLPAGYAQMVGDFPQAAIMLIAFVIGFSLLCLCLSVVFRNRWIAWLLAYVFLAVLWIGPEQGRAPINDGLPPGISVNLYYLNPTQALFQMSDPIGYWNHNSQLSIGNEPMWLRTTEAWLLLGGLSLLLCQPFVARERRRSADIPYEELVVEA